MSLIFRFIDLPSGIEASIHQEKIKLLARERIEKQQGNAKLLTFEVIVISKEIACDWVF